MSAHHEPKLIRPIAHLVDWRQNKREAGNKQAGTREADEPLRFWDNGRVAAARRHWGVTDESPGTSTDGLLSGPLRGHGSWKDLERRSLKHKLTRACLFGVTYRFLLAFLLASCLSLFLMVLVAEVPLVLPGAELQLKTPLGPAGRKTTRWRIFGTMGGGHHDSTTQTQGKRRLSRSAGSFAPNTTTSAIPLAFYPELKGRPHIKLLVGVLSAYSNFERRQVIRETWFQHARGNRTAYLGPDWEAVFIVGYVPAEDRLQLEKEMDTYGDIIAAQVPETYQSLLVKTLAILQYAEREVDCDYVLKCDDDTFVLVARVLKELRKMPETVYWGAQQYLDPILTTDAHNKWYIPKDEFPHSQSTMYMQGGSYIISKDFSDRLAKKTSTKNWNPPFPSAGFAEDAAVGLLLQEEGLPWAARRSDFRFGGMYPYGNGYCEDDTLLTYHHVDVPLMQRMNTNYLKMVEDRKVGGGTFSMCNAAKADAKVKALVDEHMYSYSDQYGADIMAGDARVLMIGSGLNHPEDEVEGDVVDLGMLAMDNPLMQSRIQSAVMAYTHMKGQRAKEPLVALSFVRPERPSDLRLLLEWINFHMVQGVSKFILYSHTNSTEDKTHVALHAAVAEYEGAGVVEVRAWPASATYPQHLAEQRFLNRTDSAAYQDMLKRCRSGIKLDTWVHNNVAYERHGDTYPYECQLAAIMDGYARWGWRANWLLAFDPDEFIYTPKETGLGAYLRELPSGTTSLYMDCASFGTSNLDTQPTNKLTIEVHTQRAPYSKFGDNVEAIESMHPGCKEVMSDGSNWPVCTTGPGKSAIRGRAVMPSRAHMHFASPLGGEQAEGGLDALCNHYVALSEEDVKRKRPAHQEAHRQAASFYNSVNDTTILSFLPALKVLQASMAQGRLVHNKHN